MAQHRKLLNRLFSRFAQQKANKEERSLFWQWLWWLDAREQESNWTNKEKDLIQERLWGNILLATHPAPGIIKKYPWKQVIAAAAAVITGIVLTGLLWMKQSPSKTYVFKSDAHATRQLLLPDSTQVILNANSSLQYSATYNHKDRRVTLTGEGYFKVRKDDLRPFIVQTDGLETQALGTAFNIEAHERENQIQVALTEGKVSIDNQLQKNILYPGQLLRYNRLTRQSTTSSFTTDVTAWTTGGISFNGIPLADALDRLAHHYQLQLHYSKKQLTGKTVTASFAKTSWQNALSSILFAHDLTYTMKDSILIIY